MKKLNIFLMMALALGFTSCEEEWVEATPQTNPQEELFTASDFVANNLLESTALLVENADELVPVAEFESVSNLPEGATVEFAMQMAKNEDFSDAVEVPVTNGANVASATVADLQTAYQAVQGRNPEARSVNVRYAAYVVNGTEKVRVNGLDAYYAQSTVTITPYDPGFRVEKTYYLVWAADADELSLSSEKVEFTHSDKDVYDDTRFTAIIDVPAGGFYWVVVPASVMSSTSADAFESALGAEEGMESETVGFLFAKNNEDFPGVAICQEGSGKYQFAIDMYSQVEEEVYPSYEVTPAFDYLYTPGNSNGWNHGAANMLGTTDYITYTGYAYLNGEFKFSNAADWDHTNYGNSGTEGELTTDGGAGNLMAANEGVYWCSVNIPNLTYSITEITTIGMIGGFNGWGESLAMTPKVTSATDIKYEGEVTLKAGEEFKFRANDGWDINLGGTFDNLTQGGANLSVSEDGTYTVVLDLSTLPYKATLTKK